MPFAALVYEIRPGHDEEIAAIFSPTNFKRADSPVLRDERGATVGYLLSTGLFLHGDRMVRLIQHEGGTVDDIARHMSVQEGVHEAERELAPYLATERDTETPEGFVRHFRRSLIRRAAQWAVDNRPAAGLAVFRFLQEGGEDLDAMSAALPDAVGSGPILAAMRFDLDDLAVWGVQHDGAADAAVAALDARLPGLTVPLPARAMRCISQLSIARV